MPVKRVNSKIRASRNAAGSARKGSPRLLRVRPPRPDCCCANRAPSCCRSMLLVLTRFSLSLLSVRCGRFPFNYLFSIARTRCQSFSCLQELLSGLEERSLPLSLCFAKFLALFRRGRRQLHLLAGRGDGGGKGVGSAIDG